MGYGKNLADAIKEKGWSVAETSRRSGVSANTLRTIIRRDSSVRYDHALRLANTLGIDIQLICKENPYDVGEVEPSGHVRRSRADVRHALRNLLRREDDGAAYAVGGVERLFLLVSDDGSAFQ